MILRNLLLSSLLLVFFLNNIAAVFTVKTAEGFSSRTSLLKRVGNVRVKRGWTYPSISIREMLPGSSFTPAVISTISSSNTNVAQYVLLDNSPGVLQGYFAIQTVGGDGEIKQLKGVDRESISQFTLTARALDALGGKAEEEDVNLEITVLDENDNSPIFVPDTLTGEISETASPGTTFMDIRATDADTSYGDYGFVRYSFAGNEQPTSSTGAHFDVNEQGQVSLVSALDRESVDTITFEVVAADGLPTGSGGLRHSTTATVTVQIVDENDNSPVFTSDTYDASVGELSAVGTVVATVVANDLDLNENKAVYFEIEDGDFDGHFVVNSNPNFGSGPSTGEIEIAKLLDFETLSSYSLTIKAFNKDATSNALTRVGRTTVRITVADENEPPIFLNTPYSASVPENVQETIPVVTTVSVVDRDFGSTQVVTLSVDNSEGWFEISQDGVISAVAPIDREYISVDQATNLYVLRIKATDDANPSLSSIGEVMITVGDKNDNAPTKGEGWNPVVCENPSEAMRKNVSEIHVSDKDSDLFAPFTITLLQSEYSDLFNLETTTSAKSAYLQIPVDPNFDIAVKSEYELLVQLSDKSADGQPSLTSTETLTVSVCRCNQNGESECDGPVAVTAGFPVAALIAIIAAILILLIIVLAVVAYRRRNKSELEKQALFYDEDDVRENLQAYHEEGGEEDNDGYDMGALQAPLPVAAPKRQDMTPLGGAVPQPRSRIPPDTDIGDYINDAKQQADSDPTAPPFDSILVFDYEGQGSDAGSLSSLNSGTTDASQDYDYLNDWGPRFKKLADMYGGGEDD